MSYKCVTSKNITPIATENNCKHSLAPMLSQALWGKRCAISKPMSVNLGIQHCLVRAGWTWKLVLYHVRWFIRLRYIYHSQLPTLGYICFMDHWKNVIQYLQYSKELQQIYWCRKFNLTGDDERGAYQITNTCMQSCWWSLIILLCLFIAFTW